VLVLSLLSNVTEVVDGLAWISNPLLGAPLSHAWSCAVIGIATKAPAVETPIGPATSDPGSGPPARPLTVDSDHDAVAVNTLTAPAAPSLLTKSRRDALDTLAAVVPGGSLLKSKRKSPW
jgi:hypothetical protein